MTTIREAIILVVAQNPNIKPMLLIETLADAGHNEQQVRSMYWQLLREDAIELSREREVYIPFAKTCLQDARCAKTRSSTWE